jgi:hypothetical protein
MHRKLRIVCEHEATRVHETTHACTTVHPCERIGAP